MIKKISCILGLLWGWLFVLVAQEVGNYGFLELPVSPLAGALGGTSVSVVKPDMTLAEQNPGLLCASMSRQIAVSYYNYVSDINLFYAGFCKDISGIGAWSVSMKSVNYGSFDGYDENGVSTGTFSVGDYVLSGSVAYPINELWNVGASAKMIYSSYDTYNAFALGVDLGVNYYNSVSGTSLSMSVNNLGGQLKKFESGRVSMPTNMTVGVTRELQHLPFCVSLTCYDLLHWDSDYVNDKGETTKCSNGEQMLRHLILGAEWIPMDNFYVAAAYNYRIQRQFSGMGGFLRGISFGCGLSYKKISIDASYARYNAADGSLMLGVRYAY